MREDDMDQLVELVRRRADIPRVRSSEVRRIIQTFGDLVNEGMIDFTPSEPS